MNQSSIDLASVFIAILAVFVAQPLAQFMGMYAAIIVGSVLGAAIAVARAPAMSRWKSMGLAAVMTGVSITCTGTVASLLVTSMQPVFGVTHPNAFLAPVAILIAAAGTDWFKVLTWVRGIIERKFGLPITGESQKAVPPPSQTTHVNVQVQMPGEAKETDHDR